MKKLTDYEVGNFTLYRIADNCHELAKDCRDSHSKASKFFSELGDALIMYGQDMEDTDRSKKDASEILAKLEQKIQAL